MTSAGAKGAAERGAEADGKAVQRIRSRRVANLTAFGKGLQSFCKAQYEWFVPRRDCGFQDGGCLILAQALVDWSGGAMRLQGVLAARSPHAQHVVARHGSLLLDSDGVGTEGDMRRKCLEFEGYADICVLDFPEAFPPGAIPSDPWSSTRIADGLRRRFGTFGAESVPAG